MKKIFILLFCSVLPSLYACNDDNDTVKPKDKDIIVASNLAEQNLLRSMQIMDSAMVAYFTGDGMTMARYYNPYTKTRSEEVNSVWKYTAVIEATNAILHTLKAYKETGNTELYDKHFARYTELLKNLYDNAAYYKGTFTLTSYTQTKEWTVYAVDRASDKGSANVTGILNVYDDQEWLIRELIEAYKLTGESEYLKEAEYLAEYVIDGWDSTLDANGNENGGITWGPGYKSKHSCSNGPLVSPLVWLSELYANKDDKATRRYITTDGKRKSEEIKKSDYYMMYAKDVYDWQVKYLLRKSDNLFYDMMSGCENCDNIPYVIVDGVKYRDHIELKNQVGPMYSYNSGSMISAAADLYRVTKEIKYKEDAIKFADGSFDYFANYGFTLPDYYTYDISGYANWFNGVMMRGYTETYAVDKNIEKGIDSFQKNLDYGYENFLLGGLLPPNLLVGWNRDKGKNDLEGMFVFTFAAEYAILARHELDKKN